LTTYRTVALRVSDFTLKCIGVFVVYLNIIKRTNQLRVLLESYQRTKWWEPFNSPYFGLAASRRQVA